MRLAVYPSSLPPSLPPPPILPLPPSLPTLSLPPPPSPPSLLPPHSLLSTSWWMQSASTQVPMWDQRHDSESCLLYQLPEVPPVRKISASTWEVITSDVLIRRFADIPITDNCYWLMADTNNRSDYSLYTNLAYSCFKISTGTMKAYYTYMRQYQPLNIVPANRRKIEHRSLYEVISPIPIINRYSNMVLIPVISTSLAITQTLYIRLTQMQPTVSAYWPTGT